MSAVVDIASQVVMHPVVSHSLKVWGTTLGRDKTYRAIQYFARYYAWYLVNHAGSKDAAARWNALKGHLATGRKLMRLFKPLEHLQAALKVVQGSATPLERWTAIGRQLSYAGYLSFDSLVWAQQIKFLTYSPQRAQRHLEISLRFWLAGIILSLLNGLAKAGRLANRAKALSAPPRSGEKIGSEAERKATLAAVEKENRAVRLQLVIDSLDVWLPATGLGVVNVNDGVAGILGLITSIMAFRSQWNALV